MFCLDFLPSFDFQQIYNDIRQYSGSNERHRHESGESQRRHESNESRQKVESEDHAKYERYYGGDVEQECYSIINHIRIKDLLNVESLTYIAVELSFLS